MYPARTVPLSALSAAVALFHLSGLYDLRVECAGFARPRDVTHRRVLPATTLDVVSLAQYRRIPRAATTDMLDAGRSWTAMAKDDAVLQVFRFTRRHRDKPGRDSTPAA